MVPECALPPLRSMPAFGILRRCFCTQVCIAQVKRVVRVTFLTTGRQALFKYLMINVSCNMPMVSKSAPRPLFYACKCPCAHNYALLHYKRVVGVTFFTSKEAKYYNVHANKLRKVGLNQHIIKSEQPYFFKLILTVMIHGTLRSCIAPRTK
jgi:hypothetical protein